MVQRHVPRGTDEDGAEDALRGHFHPLARRAFFAGFDRFAEVVPGSVVSPLEEDEAFGAGGRRVDDRGQRRFPAFGDLQRLRLDPDFVFFLPFRQGDGAGAAGRARADAAADAEDLDLPDQRHVGVEVAVGGEVEPGEVGARVREIRDAGLAGADFDPADLHLVGPVQHSVAEGGDEVAARVEDRDPQVPFLADEEPAGARLTHDRCRAVKLPRPAAGTDAETQVESGARVGHGVVVGDLVAVPLGDVDAAEAERDVVGVVDAVGALDADPAAFLPAFFRFAEYRYPSEPVVAAFEGERRFFGEVLVDPRPVEGLPIEGVFFRQIGGVEGPDFVFLTERQRAAAIREDPQRRLVAADPPARSFVGGQEVVGRVCAVGLVADQARAAGDRHVDPISKEPDAQGEVVVAADREPVPQIVSFVIDVEEARRAAFPSRRHPDRPIRSQPIKRPRPSEGANRRNRKRRPRATAQRQHHDRSDRKQDENAPGDETHGPSRVSSGPTIVKERVPNLLIRSDFKAVDDRVRTIRPRAGRSGYFSSLSQTDSSRPTLASCSPNL